MPNAEKYKILADEIAVKIMHMQDALYKDCDNNELRQDIEDFEEDYQYLRNLYEQHRVS